MKSQIDLSLHNDSEIIENVLVEKIVPGGDGLIRVDGKVFFVPGVIDGEVVDICKISEGRKFSRGRVLKIRKASPKRIEPKCPHYGLCGGCNLQHLGYEDQLKLKAAFVREHFQRLAGFNLPDDFHFVPSSPWGYRNRVQFHRGTTGAGFKLRGSDEILSINHCPVLSETLNKFLASGVTPSLERENYFGDDRHWWSETGREKIEVMIEGLRIRFRADLFFQSNLTLLPDLLNFALDDASGEHGMDLYCGVGLFSVFMKQKFDRITAIELNPEVESFYRENMADQNYEFSAQSLENWIRRIRHNRTGKTDFILVDPPRTGLSAQARKFLIRMKARDLCYVSCDPVTQARDTKELLAAGYKLIDIRGFDFYPQTHHMETVVRFRLT